VTAKTPGQILADARAALGLSLRALGLKVGGLSPQYIHDFERDRRPIPPKRWEAFRRALPSLNLRELAEATLSMGTVEIDARELTARQRAVLVDALMGLAQPALHEPGAARGGR
jgi:transcriptional regulator with XRE-family HTH domain